MPVLDEVEVVAGAVAEEAVDVVVVEEVEDVEEVSKHELLNVTKKEEKHSRAKLDMPQNTRSAKAGSDCFRVGYPACCKS